MTRHFLNAFINILYFILILFFFNILHDSVFVTARAIVRYTGFCSVTLYPAYSNREIRCWLHVEFQHPYGKSRMKKIFITYLAILPLFSSRPRGASRDLQRTLCLKWGGVNRLKIRLKSSPVFVDWMGAISPFVGLFLKLRFYSGSHFTAFIILDIDFRLTSAASDWENTGTGEPSLSAYDKNLLRSRQFRCSFWRILTPIFGNSMNTVTIRWCRMCFQ